MSTFENFLECLGGLHDAVVEDFVWQPHQRLLRLQIDDLFTDLIGSPSYPGPMRGSISFSDVERVSIDIDTSEGSLNVYEIAVEEIESKYAVSIRWWPGGAMQLTCGSIDFPSIDLAGIPTD